MIEAELITLVKDVYGDGADLGPVDRAAVQNAIEASEGLDGAEATIRQAEAFRQLAEDFENVTVALQVGDWMRRWEAARQ